MSEEKAAKPAKKSTAKPAAAKSTKSAAKAERVFTPTPEAKSKATGKRVTALILWLVAIALEAVAIFWVLRPSAEEVVAAQGFPDSRWWMLIGFLVVIGILAVVGSVLWKQANRLDPASEKDKFRFFVQNQLGAIIALIAFLPLIIVIFTNKDMDAKQKNIAGGVGIVVALIAVVVGIDFKPFSQEQAAVESQVVTALTGEDVVFWTEGGKVMHLCSGASDLANSATILDGPTADALDQGKEGITLKIEQELNQCGITPPEGTDIPAIVDWVKQSRAANAGTTDDGASDDVTDDGATDGDTTDDGADVADTDADAEEADAA